MEVKAAMSVRRQRFQNIIEYIKKPPTLSNKILLPSTSHSLLVTSAYKD